MVADIVLIVLKQKKVIQFQIKNLLTLRSLSKFSKTINDMKFQSSKVFDGFSTVFRQWKADGTHCRFLHGYDVEIKVYFEGELDSRNWVWDFGGMKRAKGNIDGHNPKEWFNYMFDHTTVVAEDDPFLSRFQHMDSEGIIQLRIIPSVGAEQFAKYVFEKIDNFVQEETNNRVAVTRVDVAENHKNAASYIR